MKILNSSLIRNISTVGASTLMTQAALLAVMPLLTRIYEPEAFGIFATFSALHSMAVIVFSLKYDVAIIVPRDDLEARHALLLSILIPTVLSGVLACILVGAAVWTHSVSWYLLMLPVSVTFASIYSAFQQWGARHRDYRHYSASQIINAGFNIILCIAVGVLLTGMREGLVVGFVGGLVVAAVYMLWLQRSVLRTAVKAEPGKLRPSLHNVVSKYRHLPMQVLPFTILTVIIQSAAPLVLNANYSLLEIGLYAVASRALLTPSAVIAAAIGEPFRAELAARVRNGIELSRLTFNLLIFLTVFSALAFTVIYVVSPFLFPWLFGTDFSRSGEIARALSFGAFIQFIILPVNQVFVITSRMRDGLIAQLLIAFVPLLTLWLASHRFSIEHALHLWSAAMLVSGGVMVVLVCHAVRVSDQSLKSS